MAELTFEQAITRLEQIVQQLESGRCALDDALKLFEEGTKLTAFCSQALRTAEQKILRLTAQDVSPAPVDVSPAPVDVSPAPVDVSPAPEATASAADGEGVPS